MQSFNEEWLNKLEKDIFQPANYDFEKLAIKVFRYQYQENEVYRNYCDLIHCEPMEVQRLHQIPFLPISAFKSHEVRSGDFEEEIVFESSGTTQSVPSKHYVKKLGLYENSFDLCFSMKYGNVEDYCVLGLLPSYLERSGSSLVQMVQSFIQKSTDARSGFFLKNERELAKVLNQLGSENKKTLLIGVSFGLVDFVEKRKMNEHENLIVIETGGMKGRRKEMIRSELHEILRAGFRLNQIHSEYGMTELLSQAYADKDGKFETPPWAKVLVRQQDDPFSYCKINQAGAINIIDLANLYSCAFIQTDDLGKIDESGKFEVLGRFDSAEVRGCNLMVS